MCIRDSQHQPRLYNVRDPTGRLEIRRLLAESTKRAEQIEISPVRFTARIPDRAFSLRAGTARENQRRPESRAPETRRHCARAECRTVQTRGTLADSRTARGSRILESRHQHRYAGKDARFDGGRETSRESSDHPRLRFVADSTWHLAHPGNYADADLSLGQKRAELRRAQR